MGVFNAILPVGSMTLTDQKTYRMMAIAAGIERASQKSIGNISDEIPGVAGNDNREARVAAILSYLDAGNVPASIDIREFQPTLDALAAVDAWVTAVIAAVGGVYALLAGVAAPVMPANRLGVIYKVGVELPVPQPVSRLILRSGGAAGNIIGVFDLEQLYNRLETEGYFSEPVIIDPNITYAMQVIGRIAAAALARVQLGFLIFEPAGQTIA